MILLADVLTNPFWRIVAAISPDGYLVFLLICIALAFLWHVQDNEHND